MGQSESKPQYRSKKEGEEMFSDLDIYLLDQNEDRASIYGKYNIQQVNRHTKGINIWRSEDLEKHRKKIIYYQEQNIGYTITISFCTYDTDIQYKSRVVQMIDSLNANDKVIELWITLKDTNPIDSTILQQMIQNYSNLNQIDILDYYDQVNHDIHDFIKQLVSQSLLNKFGLQFAGKLRNKQQSLILLEQYDKLVHQQNQKIQFINNKVNLNQYYDDEQSAQRVIDDIHDDNYELQQQ